MKKIILNLLILAVAGFSNLYGQCVNEKGYYDFPFTENGITVSYSLTGDFMTYNSEYSACGITEKAGSIWTGANGPATFQTNFSIPMNDISYNLAGTNTTEAFTVTVSNGTPSISFVAGDCPLAWSISGNVLACIDDSKAEGNAGGRIKIHSTSPYTWIKFSHNGGAGGTIFTMCFDAAFESVMPTVSTSSVTSITSSAASSGGNVTEDGGSPVIGRGVCWSTSALPTISDNKTSDGTGLGSYSSSITGLSAGVTYYLRAYATNTIGTGYGSQVSFTTTTTSVPIISTTSISSITTTGASSGGNITNDGNSAVTSRGTCWSTSPNPTTLNSVTSDGSGTGIFTSALASLTPGTLYYVRAYAINSIGTGYGNQVVFGTIPADPTSASATPSTIYVGSSTQISVTGAQGTVEWCSGSCGGTLAGSGSPLTVSPTVTTTYYARNHANSVYSAGCASVTVTVNKYDQTITFDPIPGKTYGNADFNPASASSELAISYSSSNPAVATIVAGKLHINGVGSTDITASQPGNTSYNPATPVIQSLSVSKASLTVTANNKTKVYGAPDPSLDYTITGTLYNGDLNSVVTGVTMSTATGAAATFGAHTITVSGGVADNYDITLINGTLLVSKAPALTVAANNKSKVYGDADPELDYTLSGTLYYTDDYSVISGVSLGTATGISASYGTHAITVTGGSADNYNVSRVNGTLTVSKASLTVTANDKSKVYGAADPVLDFIPSGTLHYSDTYAVISDVNLSTQTGASATFGTHDIIVTGGSADNYDISLVNGTLTVSKAGALTVTANDKSKVYGAPDPVLDYTASGILYYSDNYSVITGVRLSTATGASATFGTHIITAEGGSADNYEINLADGTLSVTKAAPLTVTANDKSKVYGEEDPALDYTPSGTLYYSDDYSVISGVTLNSATGASASYGTHAITAEGGSADNYDVNLVNGTLTVSKASLIVTANDKSKVYGAADPVLDYTPSGTLYYSDDYSVISGVSLNTATGASASYGTHTITASGGSASNYNISLADGTLSVSKAALTVTANDKSKVYGSADPILDYTPSGTLYYSDDYSVISGVSLSTAIGASASFGTHEITIEGSTAGNYDVTNINGTLTVSKAAALTISANDKSKVYGEDDPVLDFTPSGTLYYSDDYSVISGVSLSTETGASASFGEHTIVASGGSALNYNVNEINGTLSVSKAAALTVTANDKSKIYGDADPVLDFTPSGTLYYADDYSVISGVSLGTATGASASFGTHTITASGGEAGNYEVNSVNGTLTVNKAVLTARADNKSRIYGATNPLLTISYDGFKYSDSIDSLLTLPLASTTATAATGAGSFSISLTQGSDNNYEIENTDGVLTIEKAQLNVTADNKSRIYGNYNPDLTLTYSGFVNGDLIDSVDIKPAAFTTADLNSDAGQYPINAEGGSDNNYSFEYTGGTLEILKADQVITFENIPAGLRTKQQHELSAVSSSGLPVRFESSNNSIAEISDNKMSVIKEGTVIITASQEGNNNWNPATNLSQTIATLPTFDNIRSLFTPNNDGMNDYWYIPDIEQYGIISVQIYNRFGKLLYKSSAYKNDWDGTYNGTPLPEASYYYIINSSEKGMIKGVVNIVR
jgi:gliding motility-associated-like protein